MATENEQNSATQQTSKEEEKAQPKTGMVRRSQDTGLARSHRVGGLGLPLTPYEMLRMSPFALFRRMTEELDRALQPFSPENEGNANIAWTPTVELTAHIRANPAPGWLRCRFSTRFVTAGFLEEDGEVWDSTGRLVGQSRQLALVPRG